MRSFIGERSLLTSVEQRMDANTGLGVVGLNIAGVGNGLLRAMKGNEQLHP